MDSILRKIRGRNIQPQATSRLQCPHDIPEVHTDLRQLSGYVACPLRQICRNGGNPAADIICLAIRKDFTQLCRKSSVLHICLHLKAYLDPPRDLQLLYKRPTDKTYHIRPIIRCRLQQRSRLRDRRQHTLRPVGGTGILRIIDKSDLPCLSRLQT